MTYPAQAVRIALVVLVASGVAAPQQSGGPSFVRVRLWRAQPKHANVDTPVDMRCPPHGRPCTVTNTTWERIQRTECVLVAADGQFRREIGMRGAGVQSFKIYVGKVGPADVSDLSSVIDAWKGRDLGVPAPAAPDAVYSNKARMLYAVIDWRGRAAQRVWMPDQATQERFAPEVSPLLGWWKRVSHYQLRKISGAPNGCTSQH